jgi:DNA-binding beta-propeller fold protein YncE
VAVSRLRGGSVFVGENFTYRIREFNQSDGSLVRLVCTKGGLSGPRRMCLSPDETVLAVASTDNHCVKVIRVDGSEAPRTIGGRKGAEDGQFNCPVDVHFTPDGTRLVVADFFNKCVQVLGLDGSFVRKIPLGANARAVAVDAVGNIMAATKRRVKVFSPDGTLLHDRLGRGLGEFGSAAFGGLAIDPASGRVAITDTHGAGKEAEHVLSYL